MHYNIALLHKKELIVLLSYFLWKVMHYITFVTWTGLAYLFFNNKNPKTIFLSTVKALSHQK